MELREAHFVCSAGNRERGRRWKRTSRGKKQRVIQEEAEDFSAAWSQMAKPCLYNSVEQMVLHPAGNEARLHGVAARRHSKKP